MRAVPRDAVVAMIVPPRGYGKKNNNRRPVIDVDKAPMSEREKNAESSFCALAKRTNSERDAFRNIVVMSKCRRQYITRKSGRRAALMTI